MLQLIDEAGGLIFVESAFILPRGFQKSLGGYYTVLPHSGNGNPILFCANRWADQSTQNEPTMQTAVRCGVSLEANSTRAGQEQGRKGGRAEEWARMGLQGPVLAEHAHEWHGCMDKRGEPPLG